MAASGRLLLGVDCGQSTTKAGLYDESGHEVAWAGRRSSVSSPRPGWHERDPEPVWADVAAACREVVARAEVRPGDVAGVAVSGYTDGVLLVDAEGRPVRPAILAIDDRAAERADAVADGGQAGRLLSLTGQLPFAAATPVVLAWLVEHEPAALQRARWLLGCKDWIRLRMTGAVGTDRSEASASFTDVGTGEWSAEALELYGLSAHAGLLAPVVPGVAVVGAVTSEVALELGVAAGTPVVAGAHDVDAAALGMDAVGDRQGSVVLGTFSINQVVAREPVAGAAWQARSFTVPGRWSHMSTSAAGTVALDWFLRTMHPAGSAGTGEAVARALGRRGRPEPPAFVPYVVGAPRGTAAGGSFVGLRAWHDADDVLRAVLEGIAFNHRSHLEDLRAAFGPLDRLGLCGGGAGSPAWSQLLSDVTGASIDVPRVHEVGAHGSALLAGVGIGVYAGIDDATTAVRIGRRHDPDPQEVERLEQRYARWCAAVAAENGHEAGTPRR